MGARGACEIVSPSHTMVTTRWLRFSAFVRRSSAQKYSWVHREDRDPSDARWRAFVEDRYIPTPTIAEAPF